MNIADFLGGLGPTPLGSPGGSGLLAFPVETFETPLLDLTVATLNIELCPARPGYLPIMPSGGWVIESAAGTQVTPATTNAGSDAAHSNLWPSTATLPDNASVNGAIVPSLANAPVGPAATVRLIPNATVFMDVSVPASGTGGFALRARFCAVIRWASVTGS